MRTLWAVFVMLSGAALASAAEGDSEAPSDSGRSAAAIERGLGFLAQDARAWKRDHNCASCHHASLVVWSLSDAHRAGYPVDRPLQDELTQWLTESGDGRTSQARPESAPHALNEKAVYFALALGAVHQRDAETQQALERLLETVSADQQPDGSWSSWPETRPPLFGHFDARATALATLALLPAAEGGSPEAQRATERALAWLDAAPDDGELQSLALKLVVGTRLGRSGEGLAPLVRRIRDCQRPDGGWSQTVELPSDAWATGQAIYALSRSGLPADDLAIAGGRRFLIETQREDGSWPMTSRPTHPGGEPGGPGPITAAGSCWAVLGLVSANE